MDISKLGGVTATVNEMLVRGQFDPRLVWRLIALVTV